MGASLSGNSRDIEQNGQKKLHPSPGEIKELEDQMEGLRAEVANLNMHDTEARTSYGGFRPLPLRKSMEYPDGDNSSVGDDMIAMNDISDVTHVPVAFVGDGGYLQPTTLLPGA